VRFITKENMGIRKGVKMEIRSPWKISMLGLELNRYCMRSVLVLRKRITAIIGPSGCGNPHSSDAQ